MHKDIQALIEHGPYYVPPLAPIPRQSRRERKIRVIWRWSCWALCSVATGWFVSTVIAVHSGTLRFVSAPLSALREIVFSLILCPIIAGTCVYYRNRPSEWLIWFLDRRSRRV